MSPCLPHFSMTFSIMILCEGLCKSCLLTVLNGIFMIAYSYVKFNSKLQIIGIMRL